MSEGLNNQGLIADLRETCASRWSDTVAACDEQRAEAADRIEELERLLKGSRVAIEVSGNRLTVADTYPGQFGSVKVTPVSEKEGE